MDVLENAVIFATYAHAGQKRKNGADFILHPMEVATVIATLTADKNVAAAGLLHDTIEDAGITAEQIEAEFGTCVKELVLSETENKYVELPRGLSWKRRKEESLKVLKNATDINMKILWLADKVSNLRSFYREYLKNGNDFWQMFNQTDIGEQKWYYDCIAEYTICLKNTPAWQELNQLMIKIFN